MHALITARHGARETLLSLDLDERTKTADLSERLAAEVGAPKGSTMYVDGRAVQDRSVQNRGVQDRGVQDRAVRDGNAAGVEALAAESGIRDGAVVTFADPGMGSGASGGPVDLCVTGGTGTGAVVRLGVGESILQVGPDGRVRVDEPREGGLAAIGVVVALDGAVRVRRVPDPRSAGQPVQLDRLEEPLGEDEAPWAAGTQLRIGPSVLTVQSATRPDADLRPAAEPGHLDYNRPPRLLPPMPATHFRLPAEPQAPSRNPLPWLGMAMPAVLGIVMAMVFQQPYYLMFALASPLMGWGNWWMQKRNGVVTHKERLKQHAEERAALEEEVLDAVRREQHRRRVSSPGAAELRLIATTPTRRLWERRSTDGDHLTVRLGLADATSRVEVEDSAEPEHRRKTRATVRSVPVTVPLKEAGVVGLAGPGDWPRRRARWMVGQLGVLQSPRDVQVYVLTSSEHVQDWAWAAWLPHVRPSFGQEAVALIGTTTDTLSARVAELNSVITQRRAAMEGNSNKIMAGPQVVVVLDGARRLRALPGVVSILRDGPGVGVSVVCLDGDEQLLPEECTVVALARVDGGMTLRRQDTDDLRAVLVDEVLDDWYEPVARAVAAVHDVTATEGEGLIPDSARLVEVLGIEEVDADEMVTRWRMISNGGKGSTAAVVGVSLDGPFTLDMVRDGPHALVGGTTGSGKSEFLQTIVASLAVVNTPETMNFVLVDYKGGAAFSQCEQLPHTVGMVTDLDSHLVERALDSLRAELTYREHILAAAGAKDLEDYLDAQGRGHIGPTLPRLMIVIDEFASMARELPDFVTGLVNIAQRGRSLGIHLILATQRPSGVISPEIRANTNLRVALRMTDKSESKDVIDANDAADIAKSQPGRAYARLGASSVVPFQSARVGGRRLSLSDVGQVEPPFVARVPLAELGAPPPSRPRVKRHENVETDLAALVETLRETARMGGWPVPRRPWLPALRDLLPLDELAQPSAGSQFAWAMEDSPSDQRQGPAVIDLDDFGHRYVVGAPGSGRSTTLRTTAFAAADAMPVADLHLYAIDCGNGALTVLNELPHTGAVVQRGQAERAKRLLTRLQTELGRRQQVLAAGNFASVTEQRELGDPGTRLPRMLVLIDRWESFMSTYGEVDSGKLVEIVQELLRDGASAGIHLVLSGDRSLLSSRMSVLTDDAVVLRLTDRFDYGMVGIDHKKLPEEIQPGRAFRSGSALEVQVAILGNDPAGRAQTGAAREMAARIREREDVVPGTGPFRVDDLPSTITVDAAYQYVGPEAAKPMWALLGVGGDDLTAFGMDLAGDAPAFLVAGPSKSGRSTMLAVMTESLLRGGTQVVVMAPRPSILRDFEGRDGVRAVFTGTEVTEEELAPHLDPDDAAVVLVVDDAELVADIPAKTWLRAYLRTAADNRRGLIIGGEASEVAGGFSGWQVDVKKSRRGALLSPQDRFHGDLVGVSMPRSAVSTQVNPGKAMVHLGSGELMTVLVPTL